MRKLASPLLRHGLAFAGAWLALTGWSAATAQDNPWTPERQSAVVRIEAPDEGEDRPSVGAGFIAEGRGGDHYVVTATNVVLPDVLRRRG